MTFWNNVRWLTLPEGEEPVRPFNKDCVEYANYILAVGGEIYVSDPDHKPVIKQLSENGDVHISPGQFAFLLTEEELEIPINTLGFISIRSTVKFTGLVNISGFHVDPGYSGKLVFAAFNAGPAVVHLRRGEPVFQLWLVDLTDSVKDKNDFTKDAERISGYQNIPSKLLTPISGEFTTAYQVKEDIRKVKDDVTDLKAYKLYASIILGLIVIGLGPTLWGNISRLFVEVSQSRPIFSFVCRADLSCEANVYRR